MRRAIASGHLSNSLCGPQRARSVAAWDQWPGSAAFSAQVYSYICQAMAMAQLAAQAAITVAMPCGQQTRHGVDTTTKVDFHLGSADPQHDMGTSFLR